MVLKWEGRGMGCVSFQQTSLGLGLLQAREQANRQVSMEDQMINEPQRKTLPDFLLMTCALTMER